MKTSIPFLTVVALAWLPASPSASGAADPPAAPVLLLKDGGFVPGALLDDDRPGRLRWQGTPFVGPFAVDLAGVNAVHYPLPAVLPKPGGDYRFELAGGDVAYGNLLVLDDKQAELETPRLGRFRVRRSSLHRIDRWSGGGDLIYSGPNGLAGWTEPAAKKGWREELGQLVSDQAGATVRGDFALPARATVEFEVSWKSKPDFVLALGVNEQDKSLDRAFRFEVWDNDLVAHREGDSEADVASVREVAAGPGRAQFQAYLDQEQGRLIVFSAAGKRLADLSVRPKGKKPEVLPGLLLRNNKGDVRLERLRIGRWSGEPPAEAEADKSRIHLADGSILYGEVVRYEPGPKEFVVRGAMGESRVAAARVSGLFLSPPADEPPRSVRAVYQDGTQLSGDLTRVSGGDLWMTLPGIDGLPKLPTSGLRSLVALKATDKPAVAVKDKGVGTLEMAGVKLLGRLVDGRESAGASCLAWKPLASETASPLKPGASGKVVYKEPPPPAPPVAQAPQPPRQQVGVAQRALNFLAGTDPGAAPSKAGAGRRALHLRTGDVIPSEITRIDEDGVTFKTPLSESTFVPHAKVKAVELAPEALATIKINKSKRERLLTLPRMQKESPPTHLVRSKNGDYLRGRVVAMDDKTLKVELHLEEKRVPRDRISRIIWLHPDESDPARKLPEPAGPMGATRVQALRSDGIRLTFAADEFADSTLSGRSDVLGACRVKLAEVDQLLIGGAIEQAAATTIFGPWKLTNAPEPKVDQEGSSASGAPTGADSPLVGKPAPDFELETLAGPKFKLSGQKGTVVVLDFWATWCGPCIQAMPQVERVAEEFKAKGVKLVAVNLQETPAQIKEMLERHKLKVDVAMDRDGVVAHRYEANAIPQTVIVDRDGKVARLFVGGGPHFEDTLREALRKTLEPADPKEKGPAK